MVEAVVVLGGAGVGKSCLCIQYVLQHFSNSYSSTIEDVYTKQVVTDGVTRSVTVTEVGGKSIYEIVRQAYYAKETAALLVYSVTDKKSFQAALNIYEEMKRIKGSQPFTCVLVGNKVDLEAYREVSSEDGRAAAAELGVPFMEVTATSFPSVNYVFSKVVNPGGGTPPVQPCQPAGGASAGDPKSTSAVKKRHTMCHVL
ncbi:Ras of Complex, Roc, domain of DAPkinase/Ras family, putative [Angomonas deanei]|uniref:Ras of Complex, Roc, domain of DAPkinase/Ras family, putative n=1 Tax=Angomonas deanei TaxID=59799 RepID=A0A7G2CTW3_9TRYP|nr:Ras of Complex, Roc, domain of DAPkinase/Ras family, putative [Angomonas deanei]